MLAPIRLTVLAVVVIAALTRAAFITSAQTPRVRTIGFLGPPPSAGGLVQAFQRGFRDLGYIEGQNIRIEYRYTDMALQGHAEIFAQLAAGLVEARMAPNRKSRLRPHRRGARHAGRSAKISALTRRIRRAQQ